MPLKILLIDANSSWLAGKESLRDLEQIIPPLGLMYISAYLRRQFKDDVDVRLINMVADCRDQNALREALEIFNPGIVGIRGMNIYKEIFHEAAGTVKRFCPGIIVAGGGPYVTMDLRDAAADRNVDLFVVGEGEACFAELVERILDGRDLSGLAGTAGWKNGKFIVNRPREPVKDLDTLPFPDYERISMEKYGGFVSYGYNRRRQAVIFSSRGCPFHCIYCHNIFGKDFRMRSARNIFLEIEALFKKCAIKDFYFIDDNFNLDYGRAMEMFDLIIKSRLKINIYFANGIRGDIIDKPFVDKMVEAGVIWVDFSVETASLRLQKFIKKFVDLDKIAENIHYACGKGIMVNCCVMAGFPTETAEEAMLTVDFLKQFKKIVLPMFFSVKYYPHTEIYALALAEGVKPADIRKACGGAYHDIKYSGTPLIPKKVFRDIYFRFLREVFLSKERLLNAVEIQKKFLSAQEILDVYSIFFRKRVKDLRKDVLYYAK
ncbi:MAG: radical SAM protein [Candidatus Omnitrophota bacterium]